jgi:hypothetical protein
MCVVLGMHGDVCMTINAQTENQSFPSEQEFEGGLTLSGSDSRWPTPKRMRGDSNPTRNTGGASSAGATGLGRVISMLHYEYALK